MIYFAVEYKYHSRFAVMSRYGLWLPQHPGAAYYSMTEAASTPQFYGTSRHLSKEQAFESCSVMRTGTVRIVRCNTRNQTVNIVAVFPRRSPRDKIIREATVAAQKALESHTAKWPASKRYMALIIPSDYDVLTLSSPHIMQLFHSMAWYANTHASGMAYVYDMLYLTRLHVFDLTGASCLDLDYFLDDPILPLADAAKKDSWDPRKHRNIRWRKDPSDQR
jgi:hypothetical protein